MRDGDVVLALASSGLHSNGYSLVRHIVTRAGIQYGDNAADFGTTWGEALLEPTRLYTHRCCASSATSATACTRSAM